MSLCAGDLVEVRSKEEILATLDKNGRLEELPFMPQMFEYCGKRFMVQKRAHKTCDPVFTVKARRVEGTVHLNLRCDGKAFGGCQAACLLFWKEAWLKPVGGGAKAGTEAKPARRVTTEEDVRNACSFDAAGGATHYVCQTTQLMHFTKRLTWWNPTQYVEDYLSGNVRLIQLLQGALYAALGRRGNTFPIIRRIHNRIQLLIGGTESPSVSGKLPPGLATPIAKLNLQPGDLVRVKSHDEILSTISTDNWNRGLYFDVEMVPYCGGTYRVKARVERFIDEKTGCMRYMKTPAVILDGVACKSHYSQCRMFCPRAIYSWWREVWLERIDEAPTAGDNEQETAGKPATRAPAPVA